MNWEAIGAVGEIVGAGGVIVTLVYLARQVKESTRVARAEMTKDLYLTSVSAILEMTSNDDLAAIWSEIREFPDADAARRHTFYQAFFRLYELQYSLERHGLVDENIATSYRLVIRMFGATKHFSQYWEGARGEFHPRFAQYVDRLIASDGEAEE